MSLSPWILAARPKTLPAAVVPVLVGSALAARDDLFNPEAAAYCLGFALLIQIGTNYANDFFDHVRGADNKERLGPKRAVAAGLITPGAMLVATLVVFAAAFGVGLGLIDFGGRWMLPLGFMCILCGLAYTGGPFPLAYNGLGDVFVFVFFGLVAVGATFYVQAGVPYLDIWLCGAAIGLLSTNLLVANNYRDREGDAKVRKRTLVVLLGERPARFQYWGSNLVALAIAALLWNEDGSPWLLLPLIAAPLAIWNCISLRPSATGPEMIRLLGRTAALLLLYGTLLSAGLVMS